MGVVAYLLCEDGSYLVQEDGGLLNLEPLEYIVVADYGSYTVTGQSATVAKNRALSADYGAYSVVGQTANLLRSRLVAADFGSYAVAGQSAAIFKTRLLPAGTGTYSVDGQDAAIVVGGGPVPTVEDRLIKLRSFTERRRF